MLHTAGSKAALLMAPGSSVGMLGPPMPEPLPGPAALVSLMPSPLPTLASEEACSSATALPASSVDGWLGPVGSCLEMAVAADRPSHQCQASLSGHRGFPGIGSHLHPPLSLSLLLDSTKLICPALPVSDSQCCPWP